MNRLIATTFALILLVACDDGTSDDARTGAFFDPEALEEGATELGQDFTVVPCPGASDRQRWQWHPDLIRGQVLAPQGALAFIEPTLIEKGADLVIPSAHAVPLEGESVVEGATVKLYRNDELVSETTSDALGRFCLVAENAGIELGPDWKIEATQGDVTLRRTLLDAVDANVSVQTEAVYRVVTDNDPQADEHTWRNVSTMSATTLDLLDPLEITPATSTSEAVDKAVVRLKRDERIRSALDGQSGR